MLAGKANVSYLEYSQVPVFNQDLESPVLPVLAEVREQILAADAGEGAASRDAAVRAAVLNGGRVLSS